MDGPMQLILVYLSRNCRKEHVVQPLKKILTPDCIQIITGDFNFYISEKNSLTTFFNIKNLEQLVDVPTHDMRRTINHCYVPASLKEKFQLMYHSPYYSDHDALCINFDL